MLRKLGFFSVLAALWLGLSSMSAQAQSVKTQTFFFSGTCTGTDQVFVRPFSPTITATVTGGDIQVFQNPTGGVNYAFAGIAGTSNIVIWDGPGQTHVTSFPGSNGIGGGFPPIGFPVTTTTQIAFDLSCNSGPWQAFLTLFFVS